MLAFKYLKSYIFLLTLLFVSFPTIYEDKNPPNEDKVFAIPNIVPKNKSFHINFVGLHNGKFSTHTGEIRSYVQTITQITTCHCSVQCQCDGKYHD